MFMHKVAIVITSERVLRVRSNVLFGGVAPAVAASNYKIEGQVTQTTADDVVEALRLANVDSVIFKLVGSCDVNVSVFLIISVL